MCILQHPHLRAFPIFIPNCISSTGIALHYPMRILGPLGAPSIFLLHLSYSHCLKARHIIVGRSLVGAPLCSCMELVPVWYSWFD